MAEITDWYNQIPPITKYWFTASVVTPIMAKLNVFSPYTLLLTMDVIKSFQLWRPVTAALYFPIGRPADHVFMMLFNWLSLVVISLAFGIYILMTPLALSVIYVYCMVNQDQVVSFWFGTRFKARYLPWALFGMGLIIGDGGMSELVGIIIGHLYYFVMIKYPADQGVTLIRTPQLLHQFFPNQWAAPYTRPDRPAQPNATPRPNLFGAGAQQTGYDWGRGRRLQD